MSFRYRTYGIFLKKNDQGEADRFFVVYTKDFGKLELLGKGIRKIKSKLKGAADLFYLSEIEFIQGKTHKTLTDAVLIDNFKELREDLRKWYVGLKISEDVDGLLYKEEKDLRVWNLILESFKKLKKASLKKNLILKIYYYFFWRLISYLGYEPQLYQCVICERKITRNDKVFFSFEEGGVIDGKCFKKEKFQGEEISLDVLKVLRIILKGEWRVFSKLKITPSVWKSLQHLSHLYIIKMTPQKDIL